MLDFEENQCFGKLLNDGGFENLVDITVLVGGW